MAVDIEQAVNLVQTLIRTNLAPGIIQHAPDMENYLTALHDAVCPYVFTWPESGSWSQKGGGYKIDERNLTIYCMVESLNQKDIPTRTVQGVRALQAMRNLFITADNIPLASIDSGYQITVASRVDSPQSDSGLRADLPFSGVPWFGFTIPLKVRIQWI